MTPKLINLWSVPTWRREGCTMRPQSSITNSMWPEDVSSTVMMLSKTQTALSAMTLKQMCGLLKDRYQYKLFDHGSLSLICVSNRPNPPWLLRERNISAWASRSLPCSLREMRNMGPQLKLEAMWGRLHSFVGWVQFSCGFDGMLLVHASICAILNQKSWQLQVSQWTSGSEPRTSEQNGRLMKCTAVPAELWPENLQTDVSHHDPLLSEQAWAGNFFFQ